VDQDQIILEAVAEVTAEAVAEVTAEAVAEVTAEILETTEEVEKKTVVAMAKIAMVDVVDGNITKI
jgi:hypothetical protein